MCKHNLQQLGVLYKFVSWYGKDKSTEFVFKKLGVGNNMKTQLPDNLTENIHSQLVISYFVQVMIISPK